MSLTFFYCVVAGTSLLKEEGHFGDFHNLVSELIEDSRNFISWGVSLKHSSLHISQNFLSVLLNLMQQILYTVKDNQTLVELDHSVSADGSWRSKKSGWECFRVCATRETREGWPMRTVETEANGDWKSTYERGPYTWLVCWARRAGTIDFCPALVALVSPVQNIISLTIHYFALFVPINQQTRQAVMPGRLSLNMCLWVWQCS